MSGRTMSISAKGTMSVKKARKRAQSILIGLKVCPTQPRAGLAPPA